MILKYEESETGFKLTCEQCGSEETKADLWMSQGRAILNLECQHCNNRSDLEG